MQTDQLANGNYASYLAQALTPPNFGTAGMPQGIGPQFGNAGFGQPGFGQFGQGLPSQGNGNYGLMPGGVQPGVGYQGLQGNVGQPFAAQQQQQIAVALHQLAHQAMTQAVLGQQIAAVLNQLAHQCNWQAQANQQNRYGGLGPQAIGGLYGNPFAAAHPAAYGFGGFNRPQW